MPTLAADPYPWPYDGVLDPAVTALILIDWQVDFCGPGGYVDRVGYDLSLTRASLEPGDVPARPTPATTRPLKMVTMQGGVFGAVAPSSALLGAIGAPVVASARA